MNNMYGSNRNFAGMGYNTANQGGNAPVMTQLLKPDEVGKLKQKGPRFDFNLNEEEYLRAICTHKDPNTGNISLHGNPDGTHTCSICGESFTILDPSRFNRERIEVITENFNDLLQTIKTMYGPVPIEGGRQLYTFVGFIPKMAELYEIASEYFYRFNNSAMGVEENRAPHSLNMLNAMMGMGGNMGATMNQQTQGGYDPNYVKWLQDQVYTQQGQGQQAPAQNAAPAPGTPNPVYAPKAENPIGYVAENQTAQVQQGAPETRSTFRS